MCITLIGLQFVYVCMWVCVCERMCVYVCVFIECWRLIMFFYFPSLSISIGYKLFNKQIPPPRTVTPR